MENQQLDKEKIEKSLSPDKHWWWFTEEGHLTCDLSRVPEYPKVIGTKVISDDRANGGALVYTLDLMHDPALLAAGASSPELVANRRQQMGGV